MKLNCFVLLTRVCASSGSWSDSGIKPYLSVFCSSNDLKIGVFIALAMTSLWPGRKRSWIPRRRRSTHVLGYHNLPSGGDFPVS